jgi:hypothetical protein
LTPKEIGNGHSLGGYEAQMALAALVDGSYVHAFRIIAGAVRFQAPGIPPGSFKQDPSKYNVLNIYKQGDWIYLAGGTHLGANPPASIAAGPSLSREFSDFANSFFADGYPFGVGQGLQVGSAKLLKELLDAHSIANTVQFLETDLPGR